MFYPGYLVHHSSSKCDPNQFQYSWKQMQFPQAKRLAQRLAVSGSDKGIDFDGRVTADKAQS